MNTSKIIAILICVMLFGTKGPALGTDHGLPDNSGTASFKVWGNCESCKARIEKAARIDGVAQATWDQNTKIMTLKYNPVKTTVDLVQKRIAAVGHDTEKFRADDKTYNNLPGCCKYERRK